VQERQRGVMESCWQCMGDGGWHDCGEDCCCCLEPELNVVCDECDGEGEYDVASEEASHD
jgi:hypothetical protein